MPDDGAAFAGRRVVRGHGQRDPAKSTRAIAEPVETRLPNLSMCSHAKNPYLDGVEHFERELIAQFVGSIPFTDSTRSRLPVSRCGDLRCGLNTSAIRAVAVETLAAGRAPSEGRFT